MESRNLHHSITHWPNAGSDGYGGFTWGTPVLLSARWEEVYVMSCTKRRLAKSVTILLASSLILR